MSNKKEIKEFLSRVAGSFSRRRMDSKYKGMYRTRQKRNNRESNVETKPSNTCHVDSTASSGKKPTCCSSFTLLVFSALFTLLDGLLLAVGHYSLQRITTSLKHVEYHIPNYLTATMVSLATHPWPCL